MLRVSVLCFSDESMMCGKKKTKQASGSDSITLVRVEAVLLEGVLRQDLVELQVASVLGEQVHAVLDDLAFLSAALVLLGIGWRLGLRSEVLDGGVTLDSETLAQGLLLVTVHLAQ
jgi:hypothetical protein